MKDMYYEKIVGKTRRSVYAFPTSKGKQWSIITENTSKASHSNPKGQSQFYVKDYQEAKTNFNRLKKMM